MPMRFPYLKAARVKLQERKNACLRADYLSAGHYAAQFLSFARCDPVVGIIVAELSSVAQAKLGDVAERVDLSNRCLDLPSDRVECAAFHLSLLERFADPDPRMVMEWAAVHQQELLENWELVHNDQPPNRIEPLD